MFFYFHKISVLIVIYATREFGVKPARGLFYAHNASNSRVAIQNFSSLVGVKAILKNFYVGLQLRCTPAVTKILFPTFFVVD